MIRIRRGEAPGKLMESGQGELDSMLKLYAEGSAEYETGQAKFFFKRTIFSSTVVRECLRQAQHKKCCYTEAYLEGAPNIEHFRPKAAVRDDRHSPREYPGYYWLAYTWDNLLLCNSKVNGFKSDLFPLLNPLDRARSIDDPLEKESPVFIDPVNEDPRKHIRFSRDAPYGISDRAKKTIELLELGHPYLREKRMRILEHLDALLTIKKLASIIPGEAEERGISLGKAESSLKAAVEPNAEFSSMAIDMLTPDLN